MTGGEQSGVGHNTVWYAEVQPDGSLGVWESATSLPAGRMYHGCVAHEGYLYVTGGYGNGSYRNTVWYARIQSNGSIGSWATTTSLPAARDGIGTVAHNRYLYVTGGYDGTRDYTTVWYAPFGDSGTLGAWDSTTAMPAVRRCHGSCAHQDYLYVTGGFTMGALPRPYNTVWYAEVRQNGSIGSWETTTNLPAARYGHPCCAHDGQLLLTGGQTAFSYYNTVWHGHIGDSGVVDLWNATANLPETRTGHGSCVDNGYLYVIGGVNSSGNLGTVRYARIDSLVGIESEPSELNKRQMCLKVNPSVIGLGPARIDYQIAGDNRIPVSLNLYDASGRLARTLVNRELTKGRYHIYWSPPGPGTYFLRLSTPFAAETKKVVVSGR